MIDYDLSRIKLVVFDVDGVLSAETITLSAEGEPLRTVNIKDGYAIQLACKKGLRVAIITGGSTKAVYKRYSGLGVTDIFMGAKNKLEVYERLLSECNISDEEVVYVGDDIPDHAVMCRVGCPCCPKDACSDIKAVSRYVCDRKGGDGVGREILEQVLKAQGKWMDDEVAFGW